MDTKTPGNGRTYSVGTIGITNGDPTAPIPPHFSTEPVSCPSVQFGSYWRAGRRDVVILQCTEPPSAAHPSGIVWQQLFFGDHHPLANWGIYSGAKIVARAISVFPAATEAANRVAICGEVCDVRLPGGPCDLQSSSTTSVPKSGFLAVFNGGGALLWSEMLVATQHPDDATFLSDLSVRVESHQGQLRDIVTFCGATTCGTEIAWSPANGVFQAGPVKPFQAPPPHPNGHLYIAGGNSNNRPSWDGVVGRFVRPHGSGVVALEFLSLVGGACQDGLFGLVEMDADRFAVVGTTASGTVATPLEFPLTRWEPFHAGNPPIVFNSFTIGNFQLGVLLEFDAGPIRSSGSGVLQLVRSELLGGANSRTVARDVSCLGGNFCVVGSTDDVLFSSGFPSATHGAPFPRDSSGQSPATSSGYLLLSGTGSGGGVVDAMFVGGRSYVDASEAVGVAGWSEFPDHITVVGRMSGPGSPGAIFVTRVLADTTSGVLGGLGGTGPVLVPLRTQALFGSSQEWVAELGPWFTYQIWRMGGYQLGSVLGDAFGGGVAVDARGRVTVVGSTSSMDFPTVGGRLPSYKAQPQFDQDCVRAELDLLPYGVCRTDGTSGSFPPAFTRLTGDGGTTPAASLAPFGLLIGAPQPAVQRMFVDFEGQCAVGTMASILVDRPPAPSGSLAYGTYLQIATPSPFPVALPGMPGVEVWTTNSPVFALYLPHGGTLRVPLWANGLPAGSWTFSLQFFAALAGSVPFAASPAIVFGY